MTAAEKAMEDIGAAMELFYRGDTTAIDEGYSQPQYWEVRGRVVGAWTP